MAWSAIRSSTRSSKRFLFREFRFRSQEDRGPWHSAEPAYRKEGFGRAGGRTRIRASRRSGDAMDVHAYEPGDESRLIDWKTSARQGRPMVVERERLSTSRVWLLMDVGLEMTGVCPSGERAWQVAANALRMFAALSLRRSDDISLVFGDESSITRVPFNGGFAQFERTLDKALDRDWDHHRNIDALLEYARRIKDREALIVLATDEHAMEERHITTIRRITRTHPMVLIDVATMNPFKAVSSRHAPTDGLSARRVPAFLRNAKAAAEVDTHRAYMAAALEQELTRAGSHIIRSASSNPCSIVSSPWCPGHWPAPHAIDWVLHPNWSD